MRTVHPPCALFLRLSKKGEVSCSPEVGGQVQDLSGGSRVSAYEEDGPGGRQLDLMWPDVKTEVALEAGRGRTFPANNKLGASHRVGSTPWAQPGRSVG